MQEISYIQENFKTFILPQSVGKIAQNVFSSSRIRDTVWQRCIIFFIHNLVINFSPYFNYKPHCNYRGTTGIFSIRMILSPFFFLLITLKKGSHATISNIWNRIWAEPLFIVHISTTFLKTLPQKQYAELHATNFWDHNILRFGFAVWPVCMIYSVSAGRWKNTVGNMFNLKKTYWK